MNSAVAQSRDRPTQVAFTSRAKAAPRNGDAIHQGHGSRKWVYLADFKNLLVQRTRHKSPAQRKPTPAPLGEWRVRSLVFWLRESLRHIRLPLLMPLQYKGRVPHFQRRAVAVGPSSSRIPGRCRWWYGPPADRASPPGARHGCTEYPVRQNRHPERPLRGWRRLCFLERAPQLLDGQFGESVADFPWATGLTVSAFSISRRLLQKL